MNSRNLVETIKIYMLVTVPFSKIIKNILREERKICKIMSHFFLFSTLLILLPNIALLIYYLILFIVLLILSPNNDKLLLTYYLMSRWNNVRNTESIEIIFLKKKRARTYGARFFSNFGRPSFIGIGFIDKQINFSRREGELSRNGLPISQAAHLKQLHRLLALLLARSVPRIILGRVAAHFRYRELIVSRAVGCGIVETRTHLSNPPRGKTNSISGRFF